MPFATSIDGIDAGELRRPRTYPAADFKKAAYAGRYSFT
jgi:hypothetical protein